MSTTETLKKKNMSRDPVYPNVPKSLTFAKSLITNSNDQQFTFDGSTGYGFGRLHDYYNWQFRYFLAPGMDEDYPVDDVETIRAYLKWMTGSDYLPSYNADQPNDCYIYVENDSTNNHIYKFQYDENSGTLMAFVVRSDAFPFVIKNDIIVPKSPYTLSYTSASEEYYIYEGQITSNLLKGSTENLYADFHISLSSSVTENGTTAVYSGNFDLIFNGNDLNKYGQVVQLNKSAVVDNEVPFNMVAVTDVIETHDAGIDSTYGNNNFVVYADLKLAIPKNFITSDPDAISFKITMHSIDCLRYNLS